MKKIVCIINGMGFGGAERVMANIMTYLSNSLDVTLITLEDKESVYKLPSNIKHKVINPRENRRGILRKVSRIIDIRRAVEDSNPDLVLSFMTPMNIITLVSLIGTNIPIVVSERNDPKNSPHQFYYRLLRKLTYNMATGIVCQTNEYVEFFKGSIRNKCKVIYNPLKENLPVHRNHEADNIICTVGRLVEAKNQKLLINAYSKLALIYPEYKLFIYGDGPLKENIKEMIDSLNLSEKVILKGTFNDIHNEINKCKLFVLSSNFEGIPNVLLEALAMGMPCITTKFDGGGYKVLIDDYKNGLIVDKDNVEQLTEAMIRLIEDKELRKEVSKEAIKSREKFSNEKIMKQWKQYLESCCIK